MWVIMVKAVWDGKTLTKFYSKQLPIGKKEFFVICRNKQAVVNELTITELAGDD